MTVELNIESWKIFKMTDIISILFATLEMEDENKLLCCLLHFRSSYSARIEIMPNSILQEKQL